MAEEIGHQMEIEETQIHLIDHLQWSDSHHLEKDQEEEAEDIEDKEEEVVVSLMYVIYSSKLKKKNENR